MPAAHFSKELFRFLGDLKRHNERDWFNANKARYEAQVKDPALAFIADYAPLLAKLTPALLAEPKATGGSLFRIYRDTRFAKDKSPYKTNVAMQFRHHTKGDAHGPVFYLHLEPKRCFVGAGIWHPEPAQAQKIRTAIQKNPKAWKQTARGGAFARHYQLSGDTLKRPPAGVDAAHPLLEDLKRKDFIGVADIPDEAVTKPGFLRQFASLTAAAGPFMSFLCAALDLEY